MKIAPLKFRNDKLFHPAYPLKFQSFYILRPHDYRIRYFWLSTYQNSSHTFSLNNIMPWKLRPMGYHSSGNFSFTFNKGSIMLLFSYCVNFSLTFLYWMTSYNKNYDDYGSIIILEFTSIEDSIIYLGSIIQLGL